jgi:FtsP/CotA-like multicopper oxidase with cupredoxin domain
MVRSSARSIILCFVGGFTFAALLIGVAVANSSRPDPAPVPAAAAPAAAATPAASPASAPSHAGHTAGMDMGGAPTADGAAAEPAARTTPYGTRPLASTMDGGVRVFRLTAAPVKWRTDDTHTVDAWAYNGQVPGPVIRGRVGERIRIVLTNRLPEPTTVHWHGIGLPIGMDGVPGISQKAVEPGETFTYEFDLKHEGLFMYHPHFNTLAQQTRGLYGALVVDPPEGPPAGVTEMFQVLSEMSGQFLINGRSFPSTDAYAVRNGTPALFRVINVGEMDHPMHLHGFFFRQVAADGGKVPPAAQFDRYTQNVAPGEAFDLAFTPDEDGVWLFHCHILGHVTGPNGSDAGMITAVKVS